MFGALGAGSVTGLTIGGSVLIGWYAFGLEVAKTMEDQWADGLVGARTIAHTLDRRSQRRLLAAILVIQAASTIAVGAVLGAGWAYWLVLIPPIPLAVLCFGFAESEALRAVQAGRAVRASKSLWPVGLVGLFLASR
jgi:4-hydroxybenzoate polyprenyltransferase